MRKYTLFIVGFLLFLSLFPQSQAAIAAQLSATSTASLEERRAEMPEKTITGFVRHDINHNGRVDDGEPGLADIEVELWGQPPDLPFQFCTSVPTDHNGFYGFNNEYAPWRTTVRIKPTAKYPIVEPVNGYDFVLDEGIKTWLPVIDKSEVSRIDKR